MTLRDLYLRVMAALDSAPSSVKADVDSAFAEHVPDAPEIATTAPAPLNVVPAVDLGDAPVPDAQEHAP